MVESFEGGQMYAVSVDQDLMEKNVYTDPSFPLGFFYDDYGSLADHTLNCHWHPDLELGLVLQGEIDFYLNGQWLPVKEGECIFINNGTLHTAHQRTGTIPAHLFGLTFRSALFSKEYPDSVFQKYFSHGCAGFRWDCTTEEGKAVISAMEALRQLSPSDFSYELTCLSLLCRIWAVTAARIDGEKEDTEANWRTGGEVGKLLSYMHQHYQEKIILEDLERYANVSRSACFRQFRKYTGMTPMEYLNDFRLSKAATELLHSKHSVTEICYACGFSDASYFVKRFREKFGISPRKYRVQFQTP